MLEIKTNILPYVNHINDVEYLVETISSISLPELFDIINELLRSDEFETFDLTCLFIRDLVLIGNCHEACKEFIESYPDSSIVKTLEHLLFATNYFTCKQAIYTLGKTCSYNSINAMTQAFNTFRDTNPILLPRLIGEMSWLGAENFDNLVEDMMTSQVYLTRWAVIKSLSQFGDNAQIKDDMFQFKHKCYNRLRHDSNIFVQSEAEYEYQLIELRSRTHTLTKSERKKQRKELERNLKPTLCFGIIQNTFENYLYSSGLQHYSMGELESFIEDIKMENRSF